MKISDKWERDHAILHAWDEKHFLDLSIVKLRVNKDWDDHNVYCVRICGLYNRALKSKFKTIDEAKLAAEKFGLKVISEMIQRLES